jgi:hypothetical protein
MKQIKQVLMLLMVLLLNFAVAATADDCDGAGKIGEGEKNFSVEVPKEAGLGAQSFNDIGCAVISRNGECATRQGMFDSGALTYDYQSGEQLPVEKAYFAMKTDVKTPKGFGIVAFKDKAEAEKFSAAHGKGKVVKWFEIVDEKLK